MTPDRKEMQHALRDIVVPQIRAMGFTGSLPYFRRRSGKDHQFLMIFFNKYGGSFYLEAGRMTESEFAARSDRWKKSGRELTESSLTVGHCGWRSRARLGGPTVDVNADHWFKFGPDNSVVSDRSTQPSSHYRKIALQVVETLNAQAEMFFASAP